MQDKDIPQLPEGAWTEFFQDFREWLQPVTSCADEGIFAVASTTAGLAIGRLAQHWYAYPLYPNIFTLLVGKTGISHKTTVVKNGLALIESAFGKNTVRHIKSIGSAEGLLEYFGDEQEVTEGKKKKTIIVPIPRQRALLEENEFGNLLTRAHRNGTSNILDVLCDLYDGSEPAPRTRQKSIQTDQPFLSTLSAVTPDRLTTALTEEDIGHGIIGRFAVFPCSPRESVANPKIPDAVLGKHLVDSLKIMSNNAAALQGKTLVLSPEAEGIWEPAFRRWETMAAKSPDALGKLIGRVHTNVRKWGILYAVMEGHYTIEEEDIAKAILVGDYLVKTCHVMTRHINKGIQARLEEKLIAKGIEHKGDWITGRQWHRLADANCKASDLYNSLNSLTALSVFEGRECPETGRKEWRYP